MVDLLGGGEHMLGVHHLYRGAYPFPEGWSSHSHHLLLAPAHASIRPTPRSSAWKADGLCLGAKEAEHFARTAL